MQSAVRSHLADCQRRRPTDRPSWSRRLQMGVAMPRVDLDQLATTLVVCYSRLDPIGSSGWLQRRRFVRTRSNGWWTREGAPSSRSHPRLRTIGAAVTVRVVGEFTASLASGRHLDSLSREHRAPPGPPPARAQAGGARGRSADRAEVDGGFCACSSRQRVGRQTETVHRRSQPLGEARGPSTGRRHTRPTTTTTIDYHPAASVGRIRRARSHPAHRIARVRPWAAGPFSSSRNRPLSAPAPGRAGERTRMDHTPSAKRRDHLRAPYAACSACARSGVCSRSFRALPSAARCWFLLLHREGWDTRDQRKRIT